MRIHAIQTGLVRIKMSQIEGRGHGLARRLAPLVDRAKIAPAIAEAIRRSPAPVFAYEFAERAKAPLYAFPASAERDALLALPDYVLSRDR